MKNNDDEPLDQDISEDLEGTLLPDGTVGLIDKSKNVYSGTERGDDGSLIRIGHLSESGEIVIKEDCKRKESKINLSFPYETFADDHCETPLEAYEHIKPILRRIAKKLLGRKKSKSLKIYDPYYCDGGMIEKLHQLGFPHVYNKKEDCYAIWKANVKDLPDFDVCVTNPPYSGNHIEKLISFVTGDSFSNRPWLLLMPEWVHKKDFFIDLLGKKRPLYVVPKKRYIYIPPPGFRKKKSSDTHKKSSPFTSYWYIWGGSEEKTDMLADYFLEKGFDSCRTARSKNELRNLRRKGK